MTREEGVKELQALKEEHLQSLVKGDGWYCKSLKQG